MKLLFSNATFHKGLNLTVRRGVKWSFEKRATLADLQGNEYGEVDLDCRVVALQDMTDSDVAQEHDPECRTIDGLFRELKRVYPSFDFREVVTFVYFTVE